MFFYQGMRLALIHLGAVQRRIVGASAQSLAVMQDGVQISLLATDVNDSVILIQQHLKTSQHYTPYGFQKTQSWVPGFNGQLPDAITGGYLLGNGYRLYSPVVMRFYSADSWSPFGKGGLNTYAYVAGNPVNNTDPTGHMFEFLEKLFSLKDPVAATYRKDMARMQGRLLHREDAIAIRRAMDYRVLNAAANLQKNQIFYSELTTDPVKAVVKHGLMHEMVPEYASFAKSSIGKFSDLLVKEVKMDQRLQAHNGLKPSKVYMVVQRDNKMLNIRQILPLKR